MKNIAFKLIYDPNGKLREYSEELKERFTDRQAAARERPNGDLNLERDYLDFDVDLLLLTQLSALIDSALTIEVPPVPVVEEVPPVLVVEEPSILPNGPRRKVRF